MPKYFQLCFFFLFIFLLSCTTTREIQSLSIDITRHAVDAISPGIFQIQGTHTQRGSYSGKLEIRSGNDNNFEVTRIITYDHFQFENLTIQEVWTGTALIDANGELIVSYTLDQADFMSRLGTLKRTPDEFKNPWVVTSRFNSKSSILTSTFQDKYHETYSESLIAKNPLTETPLWENQRTNLDASGNKIPTLLRPILALTEARTGFSNDPYVKSFSDRPEFKEARPYIVFDPTDFDFYRAHRNVLRVDNKVLDPISLTESLGRHDAYAFTNDEKAEYYEKNLHAYHMPDSTGILAIPQFDAQGKLQTYQGYFSAGLWSGMYAGSQAMRYLVTQEPQALVNFKQVLHGLFMTMDITGDPHRFARAIAPLNQSQLSQGWVQGQGQYSQFMFKPEGNNDMVKGLGHVLAWALRVIPESDTDTWALMKDMANRLLKIDVVNKKIQNKPTAVGLAAILNHSDELEGQYRGLYRDLRVKLSGYSINANFYIRGNTDWSGINLGTVGMVTEILIAEKIGANHITHQLRERLMDAWVTLTDARRVFISLAAYTFAYQKGVRGSNFKKLKNHDQNWQEDMDHAPWGLREVPMPRPRVDADIDHSLNPNWCISPIPNTFWKAFQSPPPPVSYFYQGLYDYPVFEMTSYTSDFLWKDGAFNYKGSASATTESSGADFLFAYWMMRYAGLHWD